MAQSPPILHLAHRRDWLAAQASGSYRAESLSSEGFIHCSTVVQLPETATRHYFGQSDLVVLLVDVTKVEAEVRWETSRAGVFPFPHIYGALNTSAVIEVLDYAPAAEGRFGLPDCLWRYIPQSHLPETVPVPRPVFLRGIYYDGASHWAHPAQLTEVRGGMLSLTTSMGQEVTTDRGPWPAPYEITSYYWPDRYYNVVRLEQSDGHLDGWYCNVASPVIFDGDHLTYVDLQLDVRVSATAKGLRHEVWDEDEFEAAIQRYAYSPELVQRCRGAVDEIVALVETRQSPFDH